MPISFDIPHDVLLKRLSYDSETGIFTRMPYADSKGRRYKGGPARPLNKGNGYFRIALMGGQFNYARLVWYYVHGKWPDGEIDHINRNPADNRIANLRIASHHENMQARVEYRTPKSGYRGVHKVMSGRYQAQISVGGKKRHLGIFDTKDEAYAAWCAAALVLRGQFACLK